MVSLVDVTSTGNSSRALESLTEERAEAAAATKPNPTVEEAAPAKPAEDPRFAGKSREEILDMYRNLEVHQGRLANELGQQRRTLDELLLDKRRQDLSQNGGSAPKVEAADLLTRPQEVLDQYVNARARELVEPVAQRLNQLESALATSSFTTRHADSEQIVNSPEFRAWVGETPLRKQLAQNAAGGNAQAADALLTEYKLSKRLPGRNLEAALDKAEKATLESNQPSEPAAKQTGKTYRREDLIALRMRNPDEYNRLSDSIMQAYREGRVV